jgi:sigma-B regulation protein RsbU (phosphoserine phosphatase)
MGDKRSGDTRKAGMEQSEWRDIQALSARIGQNLFPRRRLYRSSLQVEAIAEPSQELGGDLFDIIPMDRENLLALLVGDVSGKGIPAAIFMSMLKGMLWTLIRYYASPSEILHRANTLLLESGRAKKFVTLFLVVIDLAEGRIRYSCAGHNPGIIIKAGGKTGRLKTRGLPLGVRAGAWYEERSERLGRDDLLVLYTDGITETASALGEEFGEERLIKFLQDRRSAPLHEIVTALQEELAAFRGGAPPQDDIALIMTRLLLPATETERVFSASMSAIPGLLDFVEESARSFGLGRSRTADLLVGAEEICTNVIRHSLPGAGTFTVTARAGEGRFILEIADTGPPFDPTSHRSEEREEGPDQTGGGKGLLLVRHLVDRFSYRRDPRRGNVVTLETAM